MADPNPYAKYRLSSDSNPYAKYRLGEEEQPQPPAAQEQQPESYDTAADVALGALSNAPASAVKFAQDIVQPFLHPIDTATAIGNVGAGVAEKLRLKRGEENIQYADAVGEFFKQRYGSLDAAKKSFATDPVGVLADLSTVLTGGAALPARLPGAAGTVARAAGTVGRAIDPLAATAAGVRTAGRIGSEVVGNLGTGTGGAAITTAARAGYEGGPAAQAFLENMRGAVPTEEVVEQARNAVSVMRQQRGAAYRAGMANVAANTKVLDFSAIDAAMQSAQLIKTYKGQNLSPSTQAIAVKLQDEVSNWRNLDPAEFHTGEGLDALKQKIGDIRDATQYGTPERLAADRVYNSIRGVIAREFPEYGRTMRGYEQASTLLREIEGTLSLNPNKSVDTALRKLQSVLRNNVNSNFGRRAELAEFLTQSGAPHLMEALSGQALNAWTPRGLNKLGAQIGLELLLIGGGHAAGQPALSAAAAAAIPFMSPRLVGEGAYYAGKVGGVAPRLRQPARGAFQLGRGEEE